jgi:transglutaminase-like putative cysteine protease
LVAWRCDFRCALLLAGAIVGALVSDQHITLAIGRDFGDVTPLRWVVLGGGRHDLEVAVDVLPDPVTHC